MIFAANDKINCVLPYHVFHSRHEEELGTALHGDKDQTLRENSWPEKAYSIKLKHQKSVNYQQMHS